MKKKIMLILSCLLMFVGYVAAQKTITGVVVDDLGGPLPGVSVVIKGTTTGIATSMDGRFSLNLPVGNETLVFTLVGMKHHEEKAKDEMTVTMKEDNAMLDEVVVVAYGTQKKEALTGSVNAINAKDIVKRPVSNVASALEGMGTGIQVNSSAGQAGGEPSIRIRGVASMVGSNEPLIVLDGVTFQGAISSINPEDIENISVLKDAASAALYGSRAAAGVVLISTKRGKINQPGSLNFSIRQGFSRRGTKEYKRMGSDSFMQTAYDGYRNGLMEGSKGLSLQDATSKANTDFIPRYAKYNIYDKADNELFDVNGRLSRDAKVLSGIAGDLDWFEPFERTGYRQEYNLSGSSAGEKFTMYYSASYLDDKGYITTTGFNRITGRLAATYTPKKWLKTGVTLSGSYAKYNNTQEGGSYSSNPFYAARYIAPIYPIHLHDLNTGDYILNKEGGKQYDRGTYDGIARPQFLDKHPVWELELNSDKIKRNNTGISIFGEVSFLNDFTAGVRGNMNVWTSRRSKFDNATIGDGSGASGRLNHTNYDFKDYTFSQDIVWKRTFGSIHNIDAMVSHENYAFSRDYEYMMKQTENIPNIPVLSNYAVPSDISGYIDKYRIESYLGRIRYNYDEKYFAEASYRRDGSSVFHKDNRWGNFWAVGGSWIASREQFLENISWLDMLKLRGSYGQVGNDGSSSGNYYMSPNLYVLDKNAGQGALMVSQYGNKDLKWEKLNNITVGIEARVFDRVNFTVEYFNKQNKDLILPVSKPLSMGSASNGTASPTVNQNIGTLENTGWEMSIDADVFRNKDWRVNLGMDISFIKNKIKKLAPEMRENGYLNGTKKWMEGKDMYSFFIYDWAGVDLTNGESLYVKSPDKAVDAVNDRLIDGKMYTVQATSAEKVFKGRATPDAFGNLKAAVSYKDFNLSVLCTYSIGGKVLDSNYASLMSQSGTPGALHVDLSQAWKEVPNGITADSPNRISKGAIPRVNNVTSSNNDITTSTRFLTNASYFNIKNINLSYNLPKIITSKFDLNRVTLGATIENVAIFTKRRGLNPQQSFAGTTSDTFVPTRVFSFSLNVSL